MIYIFLYLLISGIGVHAALYKVFKDRGIDPKRAFIPVINKLEWMKLTGKPKSFIIWCFIPVANIFAIIILMVDLMEAHRIYGWKEHYLGSFFSFAYFPYLFYKQNPTYIGVGGVPAGKPIPQRNWLRDWIDSLVFALSAAMIIRTFIFEPYTIPTSSLEGTLLVNDFLFVDKFTYGARLPNTPISLPLVHNTMPFTTKVNSYTEWLTLPYKRMKALSPIKRNDLVVFNYPEGDTVIVEFQSARSYYRYCDAFGRANVLERYPIATRPVDKRDNYIKRCVAVAGDTLQIIKGALMINGAKAYQAPKVQFNYLMELKPDAPVTIEEIKKDLQDLYVNTDDCDENLEIVTTNAETAEEIRNLPYVKSLVKKTFDYSDGDQSNFMYFPNEPAKFQWNVDNYGPIVIPKKGVTVQLNAKNIALYRRIIRNYESNDLKEEFGNIYINGKLASSYTFKMDYYFMMGDNRHNSQDSRFWGFVPEDHIVGRPWLIFMSWDRFHNKPRWNRLFNNIQSNFTPN